MILPNFCEKLYKIEKILGRGGRPPRSATAYQGAIDSFSKGVMPMASKIQYGLVLTSQLSISKVCKIQLAMWVNNRKGFSVN